jgi:hypothetical protein
MPEHECTQAHSGKNQIYPSQIARAWTGKQKHTEKRFLRQTWME